MCFQLSTKIYDLFECQSREGYCLNPKRKDKEGKQTCRFSFPIECAGYVPIWDVTGRHLQEVRRNTDQLQQGASIIESEKSCDLFILRNHTRLVSHIPEILNTWCANIEGRPVKSYRQVINYLLKYIMKEEPNSEPFKAMTKASIEEVNPEDPTKKVFQKLLNRTIGNHDMSKQECTHILNGLEFVSFPKKFAYANIMGTRRVEENLLAPEDGDPNRQVKVAKNIADQYWARESDANYQKACKDYEKKGASSGVKHPRDVSLYEFISKYRADWKMNFEVKVPHITPNFSTVPRKNGSARRYDMFLRSLILTHVPGTKLDDIELLSTEDLEKECQFFCEKEECPQLVREEFEESQQVDERKGENKNAPTEGIDDEFDNIAGSQDQLFIEPEAPEEYYEQSEPFERLYGEINTMAPDSRDDECLYDDGEFRELAKNTDWNEDARILGIVTKEKMRELSKWLETKKETEKLQRDLAASGGLPADLNDQQFQAFAVLRKHLMDINRKGIGRVSQLLMNINGSAGM